MVAKKFEKYLAKDYHLRECHQFKNHIKTVPSDRDIEWPVMRNGEVIGSVTSRWWIQAMGLARATYGEDVMVPALSSFQKNEY